MTSSPKNMSRIILAAGAGSRMGQTKALMNLAGLTALERIAQLNFPGFKMSTQVVVGHDHKRVRELAEKIGLSTIRNELWQNGQLSSLKAGINADVDSDYFMVHPVDLPLINQDDYDALARVIAENPGHSIYVTSIDKRRGHPLVFNSAFSQEVLKLGENESLRPLTRATTDVCYVNVTNPWIRKDLDYPDDLSDAQRYLADKG